MLSHVCIPLAIQTTRHTCSNSTYFIWKPNKDISIVSPDMEFNTKLMTHPSAAVTTDPVLMVLQILFKPCRPIFLILEEISIGVNNHQKDDDIMCVAV
jgi:hypothetical protein